jgi:hypothetical protein
MSFHKDERYGADVGIDFGEYLTTFVSEPHGQVRADVFRQGKRVAAYVSFPTGIDATRVTEPYVSALWDYARKEGVADYFHLIMS